MTEEMHDLAASYALDALDDLEQRRYEAHLAECEACRQEVARFADALAEMAARSPLQSPAGMREAVMTRVAATPQEATRQQESESVRPRSRRLLVAVSAAAVALVALAAVIVSGVLDDPIGNVLAADDARHITLESEVVDEAVLTFSPELGRAVFSATGLPPLGPDETYQLWLIDEAGATPAGLFSPDEDGAATVLVEGEVAEGLTLGLTVEQSPGTDTPTGDILIAQPIA